MDRMEGERLTKRADALRVEVEDNRKTDTEMGGLREERFGKIGRCVENETEGYVEGRRR